MQFLFPLLITQVGYMKFSRALAKSVTWRFISMLITGVVVYLVTGSLAVTGSIVAVTAGIKTVLYMMHDWLWERKK